MHVVPPQSHGFPLSPQQRRIWRLTEDGNVFETVFRLRTDGDAAGLRAAVERTIARHEILRTAFQMVPGLADPVQVVAESAARIESRPDGLELRFPALCADATTARVIFSELACLHAGEAVAPPAMQYAHYADFANRFANGPDGDAARRHWSAAATVAPPPPWVMAEGCDRPFQPEIFHVPVAAATVERLATIAGERGLEESVLVAAAWHACLARHGAASPVGHVVEGRGFAELDALPGPFDRVLPVALASDSDLGLVAVARRLAAALAEADNLQDWFVGEAWTGRVAFPLFGFEWTTLPPPVESAGVRIVLEDVFTRSERFAARLVVVRDRSGCRFRLDADASTISRAWSEGLAARFARWLDRVIEAPDHPLGEVEIHAADPGEEGAAAAPYEPAHATFARRANETPAAVAVADAAGTTTYAALEDRSNRVAAALRRRGVGPETVVGVLVDRSADLVAAVLGVLKAGGAFLPLDPRHPAARAADLLTSAAVLVTVREYARFTLPTVLLDDLGEAAPFAPARPWADQLAYVIFTSGSTGRPKGVAVTHGGLSNYLAWCAATFPLKPGDLVPLHSSAAYDMAITSLFHPVLSGATVAARAGGAGIGPLVDAWRNAREFALAKVTPGHLRQLAEELGPREFAGARTLIVGGEALASGDLAAWRAHAPETRVVNEYGPTETTVACCAHATTAGMAEAGPVPIGGPVAGARAYVLDRRLRRVPPGVVGALFVGGIGVARGYLARPDLTAERFLPDPYAAEPGRRMYATGDLVRRRDDGTLEFLGRSDRQVKVRGVRVEPGEIEALLRSCPGVAEAAAVARTENGTARLAVFVAPGTAPEDAVLRAFLADRLPDFMVPEVFHRLDAVPLDRNGKIDRARLPDPWAEGARSFAPPRTSEEEILAAIWENVLGVGRVGIDDPYFALGGDSIRALRIVARARGRGLNLGVEDLFAHQTVRRIVEQVTGRARPATVPPPVEPFALLTPEDRILVPEGIEAAYPLTRLQAGMVFHREQNPSSALYHDIFTFRLRAVLDVDRLRETIADLVARHAALRTSFDSTTYSEPVQCVHATVAPPLGFTDLSGMSEDEAERTIDEWIEAEKRRGFDQSSPPLVRFHVHRRAGETFNFSVSFHHAILDGWSDVTMLVECATGYLARLRGEAPPPAPARPEFRDYVALERAAVADPAHQAFWRDTLAGASALSLPGPRSPERRGVVTATVSVPPEVSDRLVEIARTTAVPLKSVLLACHLRVLAFLGNTRDVVTTMTAVGRPEVENSDRTLGLFLNSIPIRCRIDGERYRDLVVAAHAAERAALPHRRYPLPEIRKLVGTRMPFETHFYFTHYHNAAPLAAQPDFEILDRRGYEETSFAVLANSALDPFTGRVLFHVTCDQARFSREEAMRVAGYYERALAALAAAPEARWDAAGLLSAPEREALDRWNAAAAPAGEPVTIALTRAARLAPDRPAVRFAGKELTYGELVAEAERVGRVLRQRGVRTESRVGLFLDRSFHLAAAVPGVLLAGAACVPLDPTYPPDRLAFCAADAGLDLVLTTAELAHRLPPGVPTVVEIDRIDAPAGNGFEPPHPLQTAYVLYTSGSTGKPKGVAMTHQALGNLIARQHPAAAERTLQFAPFGFDVAFQEMFATWAAGGTLVLVADEARRDPAELAKVIDREGITRLFLPFVALNGLAAVYAGGVPLPPRLAEVVTAGEQLRISPAVRAMFGGMPGCRLVNQYGPTETHVATAFELPADPEEWEDLPPIGTPIGNARAYVLDAGLEQVPVGTVGMLYLGGIPVGRGYVADAALTASRFVPDPWGGEPGARMYATGDLARWEADGKLYFIGRTDAQVKIRGFRVEPAEIEATLAECPGVAECVVVPFGDSPTRLAAYVVGDDAADLRSHLRRTLPDHMIPATVIFLPALPLTPSGKIDRRALPPPDRFAASRPGTPPRTPVEAALAQVWASVLNLAEVGIDDNFFELGGDSILSLQVVARAARLGIGITSKQIFEHPTIAALAVAAAAATESESPEEAGDLPVTPIQHWFFDLNPTNPHHWNMPVALHVRADALRQAIAAAVRAVVARQPAFRLRFSIADRRQFFSPEPPPDTFAAVDVSGMDDRAARAAFDRTVSILQTTLDIEAGPVIRTAYFDFGPDRPGSLVLVAHHLVTDGVSWRILADDLNRAYLAAAAGLPIRIAPPATGFGRWAAALAAFAASDALRAEIPYWRSVIRPGAARLPSRSGADTEAAARVHELAFTSGETREFLVDAPNRLEAAPQELLLAAFVGALADLTGETAFLLDLESHGREESLGEADLSRTVGWFTALYPVRIERGDSDWLEACRAAVRAVPRRGIGYGLLAYLADGETREWSAHRSDVAFNYLGRFDRAFDPDSVFSPAVADLGAARDPAAPRRYLLEVNGFVVGDRLTLHLIHSPDRLVPETVATIAGRLADRLRTLLATAPPEFPPDLADALAGLEFDTDDAP